MGSSPPPQPFAVGDRQLMSRYWELLPARIQGGYNKYWGVGNFITHRLWSYSLELVGKYSPYITKKNVPKAGCRVVSLAVLGQAAMPVVAMRAPTAGLIVGRESS